jgi:NDP-sugar pyrophosphorylase family protein
VRRISSTPLEPVSVTGGVYAFAPRVRPLAADALKDGVVRMRNFLARLVDRSFVVTAVSVPRIMDLDRPSDLEAANAWLGEHE